MTFLFIFFLDSPYFQKEFPTLGQDGEPRDLEKGEAEGGDQNANRQAMAHPMMSKFCNSDIQRHQRVFSSLNKSSFKIKLKNFTSRIVSN